MYEQNTTVQYTCTFTKCHFCVSVSSPSSLPDTSNWISSDVTLSVRPPDELASKYKKVLNTNLD